MKTRTRINFCAVVALLIQPFFPPAVQAQEDDAAKLAEIIHAVAKGWEQADGTPFRDHYLDFAGARYIEGGGQNTGLSDLVEHHVEPEGRALDSLKLQFLNIESHVEGDFAWAIANTDVTATVKKDKREIHNRGYETFLFRRVDGEWKVVHTHSSSRPLVKESESDHKH